MTPEEVELLSELTIVIPTYNRPLELERAIEYWRDIPVTVHILDGSEHQNFNVGVLPSTLNISYNHLPLMNSDCDPMRSYIERMRIASNLPTTQFSALCADDDVFLESGLIDMLKLLKTDLSIDALMGRSAYYKSQKNCLLWKLALHDINNSQDYLSDSIMRRLQNWNKAPFAYYGVVRTELWKVMLNLSFEYQLGETSFTPGKMPTFELLMRTVDKALCRIGILEKVVWLRQAPNYNASRIKRDPKTPVFKKRLNTKNRADNRIVRKQIVKAILFKDPNFNLLRAHWLAGRLAKKKFERDGFYKKNMKSELLRIVNVLTFFLTAEVKLKINCALPPRVSHYFGFFKTNPGRQRATEWSDLISFLKKVRESDIAVNDREIQDYETLLLKSREELRLRANI